MRDAVTFAAAASTLVSRLIIGACDAHSGETPGAASTSISRPVSVYSRNSRPHVCSRFGFVPAALGFESGSIRISGSDSLLRGPAEERKDAIHLWPARSWNLRKCALPAFGDATLLVSPAASRSADEHLARGSFASSAVFLVELCGSSL